MMPEDGGRNERWTIKTRELGEIYADNGDPPLRYANKSAESCKPCIRSGITANQ